MATQASSSLLALIQQLEQTEHLAQRNLWLHDVLLWIRGDSRNVSDAAARVGLLVDALLARPALAAAFRQWWQATTAELDVTIRSFTAGCAPRTASGTSCFTCPSYFSGPTVMKRPHSPA